MYGMSAQKLIVTQLCVLIIAINIYGVLSIKRSSSNHSQLNQTDPTFVKERDGRQYMSGYGPGFSGNKGAKFTFIYLIY